MQNKKIFILLGHPDNTELSICRNIADSYEKGARESGFEVKRMNLCEMKFDPILHQGYRARQVLEPDLLTFQENIKWADHFVIVHPIWWMSMPALLKGMFDRVWLPGFAYNFKKNANGTKIGITRHLKGKSARIITTGSSHPFISFILYGDIWLNLRRAILRFAGFGPISQTRFGQVEGLGEQKKSKILNKVYKLGQRGK